ncbi:hypothetical protein QL285_086692 [Trifolium repens]|nr:hypothetical protein QL285_086692 [Trifolium repens]
MDRRTSETTQRDSDDASLNFPGTVSVSVSPAVTTHDDPGEAQPTPIPAVPSSDSPSATSQKLWVDAVSGNRNPANGLMMEFVAPKRVNGEIEVEIDATDIESEVQFWASSLIMYVIGGELSMNAVKQFMIRTWSFVKLPDMFFNEEGYFILRFHSFSDKDAVLMQGPYTIRNMPMLLRDWKPDFSLKRDMLRTLPIWVKLPQLPLYLWGVKSLSKIGSALGNPLVTDECTAHKLRVSYARMLIEMDVTQELPHDITIRDNEGNKMKQLVEYEWKPVFCENCQKVGHKCAKIPPTKAQNQWKPKPQPPPPVIATPPAPVTSVEKHDWTTVASTSKMKGKGTLQSTPTINVNCSNGFEPLGTLNGPLMAPDTGQ